MPFRSFWATLYTLSSKYVIITVCDYLRSQAPLNVNVTDKWRRRNAVNHHFQIEGAQKIMWAHRTVGQSGMKVRQNYISYKICDEAVVLGVIWAVEFNGNIFKLR